MFLVVVVIEIVRNAFNNLTGRSSPSDISVAGFIVMAVTLAINLWVIRYETGEGERLGSEVLLADALQTRGDVWTSVAVIVALAGARLGVPILDPLAALGVAVFIGYACWGIFVPTSGILADRMVLPETAIRTVVRSVPEVLGCHHIRTRGTADFVFLDLHIWMDEEMSLTKAHSLSHVVKDRLMARFPQIKPMKRGGGRRYYRPADLDLLRGIRHLLHNEGYTIKGVQKILREQGLDAVKSCWQPGRKLDSPGPRVTAASVGRGDCRLKIVARNGGQDNAFTSSDYTGYFQRVAHLLPNLSATCSILRLAYTLPERARHAN